MRTTLTNDRARQRLLKVSNLLLHTSKAGSVCAGRVNIDERKSQVRFRGDADMNRQAEPPKSVENDPSRTWSLISFRHRFRDICRSLNGSKLL